MGIIVESIDIQRAKSELKKCPKLVQDYVRSLENVLEMNQATNRKLLKKLKEQ